MSSPAVERPSQWQSWKGLLSCALLGLPMLVGDGSYAAPPQDGTIEVVELRHRSAEELIPVLKPLVGNTGALTGRNNQLIVRAPAAELAQLKAVIAQLDQAPKQLLVTVEQVSDYAVTRRGAEVAGSIETENGRISVGGAAPGEPGGAELEIDSGHATVRTRIYSTSQGDDGTVRHSIRVLEGNEAFIATGQDVPVAEAAPVIIGRTLVSPGSIEYRSLRSGFAVLPRVSADIVTLTVTPQRMQQAATGGGVINVQEASTTLSGRLGEWIEFGGVETSERVRAGSTLRSTARESSAVQQLRFMVTVVNP